MPFGPLECVNEPAQGFRVSTANFINWIALICNAPSNLVVNLNLIDVTGLSLAAPITVGTATTASITITNRTNRPVKVPWQITVDDGRVVASRTNVVTPNTPVTFTASWTARSGGHRFVAQADPQNTLVERGSHRANNSTTLDVTLPGPTCAAGMKRVCA